MPMAFPFLKIRILSVPESITKVRTSALVRGRSTTVKEGIRVLLQGRNMCQNSGENPDASCRTRLGFHPARGAMFIATRDDKLVRCSDGETILEWCLSRCTAPPNIAGRP